MYFLKFYLNYFIVSTSKLQLKRFTFQKLCFLLAGRWRFLSVTHIVVKRKKVTSSAKYIKIYMKIIYRFYCTIIIIINMLKVIILSSCAFGGKFANLHILPILAYGIDLLQLIYTLPMSFISINWGINFLSHTPPPPFWNLYQ